VDATGCFVTPGFIESHTHFDATMWWQNDLNPLPGYGATTIVMGNCGFSAAPISDDLRVRDEIDRHLRLLRRHPISKPFVNELPWDLAQVVRVQGLEAKNVKLPLNYAAFCRPHRAAPGCARRRSLGRAPRPTEEIARMANCSTTPGKAGALGLSTNLHRP
jgi:N-acyl-D-amino-acid deacylase